MFESRDDPMAKIKVLGKIGFRSYFFQFLPLLLITTLPLFPSQILV